MADSTIDPSRQMLGVGWSFPLSLGADGAFTLAAYEEDVRQSIYIILQTNPGDRVMRPEFGAGLNAFSFEPINTTTIAQLQKRVRSALVDFEPRIDVKDVIALTKPGKPGTLFVAISYLVRTTNTLANLVFPFFLNEGAAG